MYHKRYRDVHIATWNSICSDSDCLIQIGGAFNGYIKKFISNAFTVIVQLTLMQLAIILLNKYHFVLALSTSMIALRTPHMLQEFMQSAGGGSASGKLATVTRVVNTFRGGITKGKG